MSKREIIDHIQKINPTAASEFLARFSDQQLLDYLRQLQDILRDRAARQTEHAPALALN